MSSFEASDGDESYTSLLGKGKVPKNDRRIEALGTVDECTATLGLARALARAPETTRILLQMQRDLYILMAEIASPTENVGIFSAIDRARVTWLEETTHSIIQKVTVPDEFIVPGDTLPGAMLDLTRTVVRRAERRVAELLHSGDIQNRELVRYLNQASTLCFFLELYEISFTGKDRLTLAKE
jgi:cob(I)alamin adenosyltransferase